MYSMWNISSVLQKEEFRRFVDMFHVEHISEFVFPLAS